MRRTTLLIVLLAGAAALYFGLPAARSALLARLPGESMAPLPGDPPKPEATPLRHPLPPSKPRRIGDTDGIEFDSELMSRARERDEEEDQASAGPARTNAAAESKVIGTRSEPQSLIPNGGGAGSNGAGANPILDAFREVSVIPGSGSPNSDRIYGGRVQRGGLGGSSSASSVASSIGPGSEPTIDPDELNDDTSRLQRVGGQARGYTMLQLMQPEARRTVERQITGMLRAQVQDLYLGVLVDGTFGEDLQYLASVLNRLTTDGRTVTLVLYASNGATMRDFDTTTIDAGFNQIDPNRFRNQILRDRFVQARFSSMVRKVVPVFEYNSSLNPDNRNFLSVMLEDNLDQASYRMMRDLAFAAMEGKARLVRSPCVGCCTFCRPPSDESTFGEGVEYHRPEDLNRRSAITGFTLDGVSYLFPGEAGQGQSFEEVVNLMAASEALGAEYFGLWRAQRQGIYNAENPHPRERVYEVPTNDELIAEQNLMRVGLVPLVTPTPAP